MSILRRAVMLAMLNIGPAEAQDFLTPREAAAAVADGRPWSALTSEGQPARLTLNPDGTGRFEGPVTLGVGWTIRGEEICLRLGVIRTRCLRFQPIPGGYEAWAEGARDLRLTR
jgi:hypothetical protein